MSYTYLLDAGEESSAESFSAIPASVLSRLNLTAEKCCSNGSETESFHDSRFGTTSEPSMGNPGEAKSMLLQADFHARTSAAQDQEGELKVSEVGFGEKWPEWFAKFNLHSCSWKIRQCSLLADLDEFSETWPRWGTMLDGVCLARSMPVTFIIVREFGFSLPTVTKFDAVGGMLKGKEYDGQTKHALKLCQALIPTIGKNEFKGSSHKRFRGSMDYRGAKASEGLRTCVTDPIYLSPWFGEWMMDWPLTWTESVPLEMAKFRQWLRSHGAPSQDSPDPSPLTPVKSA